MPHASVSACRAIELYDQDISFLSNRAAVHFEKGDYEQCIADCDEGEAVAAHALGPAASRPLLAVATRVRGMGRCPRL